MRWPRPLPYEINVDKASIAITTLLAKEVDKNATTFGNYDVAKSKITMDLKTTSMMRKKKKIFLNVKEQFGEEVEWDKEEEDNEDDEDTLSEEPLSLTQGQGEDQGEEGAEFDEGFKGEEANEALVVTKEKKRK